jgi:carboxypeptidase C (cathepsin A)
MKSLDKLTFVSVDEAGHMPSITQPEAVAFVIKCWTARERDEACFQFDG